MHMQPARAEGGAGFFPGDALTPGSDQTYPIGTPVTYTAASDELDEHALASTVTNILGVSVDGVVSGEADDPSGKVSYVPATRNNVFAAKLQNGGSYVAPDEDNRFVQYGLIKVGTGSSAVFAVDEADTTDVVVEVIDIDLDREIVFFKFIESAIQHI